MKKSLDPKNVIRKYFHDHWISKYPDDFYRKKRLLKELNTVITYVLKYKKTVIFGRFKAKISKTRIKVYYEEDKYTGFYHLFADSFFNCLEHKTKTLKGKIKTLEQFIQHPLEQFYKTKSLKMFANPCEPDLI